MQKTPDLRVQKTLELIRSAFLALVREKGFENVTVKDICGRAPVNRSTFYLHYLDKFDLLQKIIADVTANITALIGPKKFLTEQGKLDPSSYQAMILSLFQMIDGDHLLYKTLLGISGSPNLLKELESIVKEKIAAEWRASHLKQETLPIPLDFFLQVLVSVFVGVTVWWIDGDFAYPAEYMAEQVTRYLAMSPAAVVEFGGDEPQ